MNSDSSLFELPTGLLIVAPITLILLRCSVCDIRHRIIPNRWIASAVLGILLYQLVFLRLRYVTCLTLISNIGVSFVISGVLFCVSIITGSLGAGDAKMAFVFGLFGRRIGLLTVGIAFILAAVFSVFLIIRNGSRRKRYTVPLAPFYTLSFLLVFLFGTFC